MRARMFKLGVPVFVAAVGALAPQVARASPDGSPIAPNQSFAGRVNGGKSSLSGGNGSAIFVDCVGTSTTGTARMGQTVGVELVGAGKTGSSGTTIKAVFVDAIPKTKIAFTVYEDVAIPTSMVLPCTGSGTVKFKAPATSPGRVIDFVSVSYIRVAP
jgi:hypothetical protein